MKDNGPSLSSTQKLLLVVFLCIGFALSISAQNKSVSLKETLRWMKETLATHSKSTTHLAGKDVDVINYRPLKFSNCVIEYETNSKTESLSGLTRIASADTISIPLASLDPSKVRVSTERDEYGVVRNIMVFTTFKNKKLIRLNGTSKVQQTFNDSPAVFVKNKAVEQSAIQFDDVVIAQRFTNAMIHAIKLCGGKSEPF